MEKKPPKHSTHTARKFDATDWDHDQCVECVKYLQRTGWAHETWYEHIEEFHHNFNTPDSRDPALHTIAYLKSFINSMYDYEDWTNQLYLNPAHGGPERGPNWDPYAANHRERASSSKQEKPEKKAMPPSKAKGKGQNNSKTDEIRPPGFGPMMPKANNTAKQAPQNLPHQSLHPHST